MITQTYEMKDGMAFRAARGIILAVAAAVSMGLLAGVACAQYQPAAPAKPVTTRKISTAENSFARGELICGGGATTSAVASKPTVQCGAVFGIGFLDIETGVMGPQANRSDISGYLSSNLWLPLNFNSDHGIPVVVGGYTRMFETGHALDYGLAYLRPIDDSHSIQFEVRDYWTFANPNQHNVVFRVAWMLNGPNSD